jgi:hypothetical protein
MRRMAIALAGAAALTVGGALMWGADAQIERGPAALAAPAENFTPVERAACGPHWGRFCGPWHTRVCGRYHAECEDASPASLESSGARQPENRRLTPH